MRVSVERLRAITSGALEIEAAGEGVYFHRIPRGFRPFYEKVEKFHIRMQCPSGVRIRFVSNTCSIHVGQKYGDRARELFQGSLFVDGKQVSIYGPQTWQEEWYGEIYRQERAEEHQFEIWLPHCCEVLSFWLEVDDESAVNPALPHKLRWLVYGASLTQCPSQECHPLPRRPNSRMAAR